MATKERYINLFSDYGFKSLKYYRDMKNSLDTAFDEGKAEGVKERDREIVIHAFQQGFDTKMIADLTGLPIEDIEVWNPNIKK